jgi:DNA-binding Lrp family transcriptional regulator
MDKTLALVLIKTELGKAKQVAQAAAEIAGTDWSIVVTGPHDVVVAVKVDDSSALGSLVVDEIQHIPGVREASTLVVTHVFQGTIPKGNEMFP